MSTNYTATTSTQPSSHFYAVVLCHDNCGTILEVGNYYDLYINATKEDYFHIYVNFTEDEVITLTFHKSEVGNYVHEVWKTTDYSHIDDECTGCCDECSCYGTLCNGLV